jgi:dienelactone hydrolase
MDFNWTQTGDPSYVRPILELVFGGGPGMTPSAAPGGYAEGSPLTHVSADDAPFCMIHGTADTTSPSEQVALMESALRGVGVAVDTLIVPGAPHDWKGTTWEATGAAKRDACLSAVLMR